MRDPDDHRARSEGSRVTTCPHPAHVAVLTWRAWHHDERDTLDRRHLMGCEAETIEACPDYHASHCLPPEPLALEEERCCAHGCFLKDDGRAYTECVSVSAQVRLRRQAEVKGGRGAKVYGPSLELGGGSVIVTSHLDPEVTWGLHKMVYDPAMTPLKDDGWGT